MGSDGGDLSLLTGGKHRTDYFVGNGVYLNFIDGCIYSRLMDAVMRCSFTSEIVVIAVILLHYTCVELAQASCICRYSCRIVF